MANEKVLLVDDEPAFTEILAQRMESRGVEVDTAANGRQALEKVAPRTAANSLPSWRADASLLTWLRAL